MSQKPPAFLFFPADWLVDVGHLSDAAYRAYHQILCYMWKNSEGCCSLCNTNPVLSRATGMRGAKLKKVMAEIQHPDMPLLREEGSMLVSNRLRKEYEKYAKKSKAAKKSADARWRKRTQCERNANASDPHTVRNATNINTKPNIRADPISNHPDRKEGGLVPLSAIGGFQPADPASPLDEVLTLEQDPSGARGMWVNRLARLQACQGGMVFLRDCLNEVRNRGNPKLCKTKGYSESIDNPARWLNGVTARWLQEREKTPVPAERR